MTEEILAGGNETPIDVITKASNKRITHMAGPESGAAVRNRSLEPSARR
jgi:hypothetical protein